MARPKGSKNKSEETDRDEPTAVTEPTEKVKTESDEETVSLYEAAEQLRTNETTIKVWIDHGHLRSINGRIPVRSIRECRFNTRRMI